MEPLLDWDQLEGMTVDFGVVTLAALLAFSSVGDWLIANPDITYWALAPLHLAMLPWMTFVLIHYSDRQVGLRPALRSGWLFDSVHSQHPSW